MEDDSGEEKFDAVGREIRGVETATRIIISARLDRRARATFFCTSALSRQNVPFTLQREMVSPTVCK